MGTRYETQDFVLYDGEIMVVVDIDGHRTDSPTYIVEKDRLNATTHRVKASELSKIELDGHHPDTIVTDIEEEAEKQANRHAALVWSNNGRHEEADMIIAQFGEFYGVNGHDVQRHRPDTNGMERISGKGGSVPSAEAEVEIQEVVHEVSKNYKNIPRESIDRVAKAEFGSDTGMTYIVTSGQATHYKETNEYGDTVSEQNRKKADNMRTEGNPVSDLMDER